MILPSKHVSETQTLLGIGAHLLRQLDSPHTVTSIWEKIRFHREVGNYERFVLALDMLYIAHAIQIKDGMIERVRK